MRNQHHSKQSERGQAMAEYGILISLLSVLCIGGLTLLGQSISGVFDQADRQIAQQVTANLQTSTSGSGSGGSFNGNKLIVNTGVPQTGTGTSPNSGTPVAMNPQTGTLTPPLIDKLSPSISPNTASDGHSVHTTTSNPTPKVNQSVSP